MKNLPQDLVQFVFLLLPLYFELYKVLLLELYEVGDKFTEASQGWTFPLRLQEVSESSRSKFERGYWALSSETEGILSLDLLVKNRRYLPLRTPSLSDEELGLR